MYFKKKRTFKIKKIVIVGLIILGVILCYFLVNKYLSMRNNVVQGYPEKTCIVYSNKKITNDNIGTPDIIVKDSDGQKINVSFERVVQCDAIRVLSPKNGYIAGSTYTIEVGDSLSLNKDTNLKKEKFKIVPEVSTTVVFKDKNLEKIVRQTIHKESGNLKKSDLSNITMLIATSQGISDLSGIEQLTCLRELYLDNNKLKNISKLSKLYDLEALGLSGNKITDISSLKNLKNLDKLYLGNNNISNFNPVKSVYQNLLIKDFYIK